MSEAAAAERKRAQDLAEIAEHLSQAVDGLLDVARILACARIRIEALNGEEQTDEREETPQQPGGSQAEAEARLKAAAPILMRGLEFMRSAHGRPDAEEPEETR